MRGRQKLRVDARGSTLVELIIGLSVLAMVGLGFLLFYNALITSSIAAKQKAVASTLVTDQMEYLKSLPYNSLAVAGGSIYTQNPLPASSTKKVNNYTYTIKTSINYVDDAFDGCTNYPTQALKQKYCRNYPAPTGAPSVDQNPQDYKVVHVAAYNRGNVRLAEVDTQIAARVAETASNTGSLFVTVIDDAGSPVSGATVQVTNSTITPAVQLSDSSDSAGIAIFYGLPPDTTGFDYQITASKTGYSALSTIKPSGTLQPSYPNQNVFAQQPSYTTLAISPMSVSSLVYETYNTSGSAIDNVKLYIKGGYKKYTAITDTSYYYDNLTPDTRPTSDASGQGSIAGLSPGNYYFCGNAGATSCSRSGTTYYLAAAVPYGGPAITGPVGIPSYEVGQTTFDFGGNAFVQKVRLIFTTSSSFPRVTAITPAEVSLSSGTANAFGFQVDGANLPCSSTAASCSTSITVTQSATTRTASCTGTSAGLHLDCTVDLSGLSAGRTSMSISASGTLNLPGAPLQGGFNVAP
jgi:hypothetical protein